MPQQKTRIRRALRMGALELVLVLAGIMFVRREVWQLYLLNVQIPYWQEGLLLPLAAVDGAITGYYSSRRRNVEHTPSYRKLLRWGTPAFVILYVACAALCERLPGYVGTFAWFPQVWRSLGMVLVLAGLMLRLWSQISAPSLLAKEQEPESEQTKALEEQQPAAESPAAGEESALPTSEQTPAKPDQVSAFVQKIAESAAAGSTTESKESGATPTPLQSLLTLSHGQFPRGPHRLLRYPDASARLLTLVGVSLCFNAWLPLLAIPGVVTLLKWHISDQDSFRISQLGEPYLEYRKSTWALLPYIY